MRSYVCSRLCGGMMVILIFVWKRIGSPTVGFKSMQTHLNPCLTHICDLSLHKSYWERDPGRTSPVRRGRKADSGSTPGWPSAFTSTALPETSSSPSTAGWSQCKLHRQASDGAAQTPRLRGGRTLHSTSILFGPSSASEALGGSDLHFSEGVYIKKWAFAHSSDRLLKMLEASLRAQLCPWVNIFYFFPALKRN